MTEPHSHGLAGTATASALFPPALVGCIRDDRPPREEEVRILAVKLWAEGLSRRPRSSRGEAGAIVRIFLCGDDPLAEDGNPGTQHRPRVERVLNRILALDQHDLAEELGRVRASLADRHRDVEPVLRRRFHDLVDPHKLNCTISDEQMLLVGAYFTEEEAFEAAALFNPSIAMHPNQSGVPQGSARIVISLRGLGEGHVSSITFRTGVFAADGTLGLDPPSRWAISPKIEYIPGGAPEDPGVRMVYEVIGICPNSSCSR